MIINIVCSIDLREKIINIIGQSILAKEVENICHMKYDTATKTQTLDVIEFIENIRDPISVTIDNGLFKVELSRTIDDSRGVRM